MPVIQGGRWQRWLQKYFGIKGEVVATELAPEIYATYEVGGRQLDPADAVLGGWRLFAGFANIGASVGNVSFTGLRNPTNSNVIAVITRWRSLDTGTELFGELFRQAGLSTNTNLGIVRDLRAASGGPTGAAVCTTIAGNPAAQSGTRMAYVPCHFVSGVNCFTDIVNGDGDELILVPGDDYEHFTTGTNIALRSGIWWRERSIEPPEITA